MKVLDVSTIKWRPVDEPPAHSMSVLVIAVQTMACKPFMAYYDDGGFKSALDGKKIPTVVAWSELPEVDNDSQVRLMWCQVAKPA